MDEEAIEQEAYSLLYEYAETFEGGSIRIPIPVEPIAELLYDFRICREELENSVAGKLFIEDRVIILNAEDNLQRQRFTVAHELGHVRLHAKRQQIPLPLFVDYRNDIKEGPYERYGRTSVETQANRFASALLMPRESLRELYRNLLKTRKFFGNATYLNVVRNKLSMESVLDSYQLNDALKNVGADLRGHCPFGYHPQIDYQFHVSLVHNRWWCDDCKKGGDVVDLIQEIESEIQGTPVKQESGDLASLIHVRFKEEKLPVAPLVVGLAEQFEVSYHAMDIRLKELRRLRSTRSNNCL